MRTVKLLIGSLFAITLMGGCGFLSYFFIVTSYLPDGLSIFVGVVCAIGALITFYLWISASMSLLREDRKKQFIATVPNNRSYPARGETEYSKTGSPR